MKKLAIAACLALAPLTGAHGQGTATWGGTITNIYVGSHCYKFTTSDGTVWATLREQVWDAVIQFYNQKVAVEVNSSLASQAEFGTKVNLDDRIPCGDAAVTFPNVSQIWPTSGDQMGSPTR